MEKKSRLTKQLINLFWGIIVAYPLVFVMILFVTGTYRNEAVLNYSTIDGYLTTIANNTTITTLSNFLNNYLWNLEKGFLQLSASTTETNYFIVINAFINWYIIAQIIHLMIDLVMFIPNVVKHSMNKLTGGEKE